MISKEKKEVSIISFLPIADSLWAENIYTLICQDFIYQKYVPQTKSVETLEKVLFIVQYKSIRNKKGTFYDFMTYINNEKKSVRIKYISDMLRVKEITEKTYNDGFGINQGMNDEVLDIFKKEVLKYKNKSNEEIEEEFKKIIERNDLSNEYFSYKNYDNRFSRRRYRAYTREIEHPNLSYFKTLVLGLLSLSFFILLLSGLISLLCFGMISLVKSSYIVDVDVYISRSFYAVIASFLFSPFFLIWLTWTVKWGKPTEFELENRYEND